MSNPEELLEQGADAAAAGVAGDEPGAAAIEGTPN